MTAYGAGDSYWHQNDGIRVDLEVDKDEYLPGEEAIVVVKSPVHGPALVTVERAKVRRHFTTQITSNAHAVKIPVSLDDAPNVFVSVMIVRGGVDSEKKFPVPEYRMGYCELKVRNAADKLNVEIAADRQDYRPGKTVAASVTVSDHKGKPVPGSEVTLYAVDQGVLDLMDYALPDPLSFFHQPQRLAVRAGTTLSSLLAENPDERGYGNKGVIIGGGGLQSLPKGQLRKNFKPCAFWDGNLITDGDGKVTVQFQAPDNLTEYHLFAVAAEGARRFGGAESRFKVNKPLMLEPALPRFANAGDRIVAKGVVHNTSQLGGEFVVSLELGDTCDHEGAELEPMRSHTLSLEPGQTSAVEFPIVVHTKGEAKWNWMVQPQEADNPAMKELVDAVETRFPVTWPIPELRESHFHLIDSGRSSDNVPK